MPLALWALSDRGSRCEIRELQHRRNPAQESDERVVRMSLKRRETWLQRHHAHRERAIAA